MLNQGKCEALQAVNEAGCVLQELLAMDRCALALGNGGLTYVDV